MTDVRPKTCATAHEWAQRLVPAEPGQPPTVLEKVLLDNGRDAETDVLLHDPVAAVPVLSRAPGTGNASFFTYTLQRLPTRSPLAAHILSSSICWVRTQDGALWLAPEREGWGIGFGYSGSGCHTLARLVDVLLDDISAPAVKAQDPGAGRPAHGPRWCGRLRKTSGGVEPVAHPGGLRHPQHLCAVFNITPDTGLRYTRTFHPDPLSD